MDYEKIFESINRAVESRPLDHGAYADLFLLSEVEIFGKITKSKVGEGSQYAYYAAGNSTIKKLNGYEYNWWERSPFNNNDTTFCDVSEKGISSSAYASYSDGVSFGFCV